MVRNCISRTEKTLPTGLRNATKEQIINRNALSLIVLLVVTPSAIAQDSATERLMRQNEQFQEQIIEVADNVHIAVGYSVSNVSMIVGDDGVVLVDIGPSGCH